MITEAQKTEIKTLMMEAGGVREVARQAGVNYDTFWNVMRDLSSDYDTVQKMINKAKQIIKRKEKQTIKL